MVLSLIFQELYGTTQTLRVPKKVTWVRLWFAIRIVNCKSLDWRSCESTDVSDLLYRIRHWILTQIAQFFFTTIREGHEIGSSISKHKRDGFVILSIGSTQLRPSLVLASGHLGVGQSKKSNGAGKKRLQRGDKLWNVFPIMQDMCSRKTSVCELLKDTHTHPRAHTHTDADADTQEHSLQAHTRTHRDTRRGTDANKRETEKGRETDTYTHARAHTHTLLHTCTRTCAKVPHSPTHPPPKKEHTHTHTHLHTHTQRRQTSHRMQ